MSPLSFFWNAAILLQAIIALQVASSPVSGKHRPPLNLTSLRQTHRLFESGGTTDLTLKDKLILARRYASLQNNETVKRDRQFSDITTWIKTYPSYLDRHFHIKMRVGMDPNVTMILDTGTDISWVLSKLLPLDQQAVTPVGGYTHDFYFLTGEQNQEATLIYDDNLMVTGPTYFDKMGVRNLVVDGQEFIAASGISPELLEIPVDGHVGMSFDRYHPGGPETFLNNIRTSLHNQLFVANLRTKQAGHYDFGFIDPHQYDGDINWTPVQQNTLDTVGKWAFEPQGYLVGGPEMNGLPFEGIRRWPEGMRPTIIDTATRFTILPELIVDHYYGRIPGAEKHSDGTWMFPCSLQPPQLTIYLDNGKSVTSGLNDMMAGPVCGVGWGCQSSAFQCRGYIISDPTSDTNVLGTSFLKDLFVVFNYDEEFGGPSIGFARQIPLSLQENKYLHHGA